MLAAALLAASAAHAQQPLFTFVQISDSQPTSSSDQAAFEAVLQTIAEGGTSGALLPYPVAFVLFAGDLVDNGSSASEWTSYVDTMDTWLTDNGIVYRAVPGNHDRGNDFSEYEQYIGPSETWSMGGNPFVGHNGLQVATGWDGLRFIGVNNTNGGDNVISSSDLDDIDTFVAGAVANDENIFFIAHHLHDERSRIPLSDVLETPEVVAYMHGHLRDPHATKGLRDISNPNVWETNTNSIFEQDVLIYFEVYQTDIDAYVLMVDEDTSLPSPKTIDLVHELSLGNGVTTTTLAPTTTTTTTLPACASTAPPDCAGSCAAGLGCLSFGGFCACGTTTTTTSSTTTTTLSPSGAAEFRELQTGSASSTNTVATASSMTAAVDDLYLAAVSSKRYSSVVNVSGLGLAWSPVRAQCAARSQGGVTIWSAQGVPDSSGAVTATLADTVESAAIAVTRYRGARMPGPLETVASANTHGLSGPCSNGSDSPSYSFPLQTSADNSIVHLAVSMRHRSHFPGAGFIEHGAVVAGGGGGAASLSIADRQIGTATVVNVNGSFDNDVDWSAVAVEILARDLEPCLSSPDCDDLEPCTDDVCEVDGLCSHTDNSASCDDGVFCNGADTCSGGSCSAHAGDPCSLGVECSNACDETSASCNAPAGDACTDDGNPCTDDVCNGTGACAHPDNTAPCDDGLFCNGADTCIVGTCSQHAGDPCTGTGECAGTCDDVLDSCGVPAGISCTDDGNPCTDDECDGAGGCIHPPNSDSCDDGVYCNGADTCSGGSCSSHAGDPCAGGAECSDVCNESAQGCDAPPTTPCTDDGNPCTDDECDGTGACIHPVNTAPCPDSDPCNGEEMCSGGVCGPGAPEDCDDGDPCTADACTTGLGCEYTGLCGSDEIILEQTAGGGSTGVNTVATGAVLDAAPDQLYLAAITSKHYVAVLNVEGLGLDWTAVAQQCSGRNQTGSSVWAAHGSPVAAGAVTATLAGAPSNAAIVVARYSGVDPSDPIGTVVSANTTGVAGACSGGSDSGAYALDIATSESGSLVCVLPAMRNRQHTPGTGYTERTSIVQGSGGAAASVALADMLVDTAGDAGVDGTFSGSTDWAVVAVELQAAAGAAPCAGNADCGDDGNACSDAVCAAGLCNHVANTDPCDDGLFCNGADTCGDGSCSTHAGDPCSGGSGGSGGPGGSGGSECGATCNELAGQCQPATGAPCTDDGNVCTDDVCDASGNCTHPNNVAECPDGDLCNGDEVCLDGSCQTGTPLDCSDGDECTDEGCSAAFGCTYANLCGSADIVLEEVASGGAAASVAVSTDGPVGAALDRLYLASITTKRHVDVLSVSGLGLTWAPAASQCSGRSQTGVHVWIAHGTPSAAGVVTASLAPGSENAAIVVSRYSGVDPAGPIGATASANTNGEAGACSGGTDGSSYSFGLTTTAGGSVVFVSAAMRNRSHEPAAGYVEQVELAQGSGGGTASLALADALVDEPGGVTVAGTLSSGTDWSVVALELLAAPAGGP